MNRQAFRAFHAATKKLPKAEKWQAARFAVEGSWAGPLTDAERRISDAVLDLTNGPWYHGGLPGRAPGDSLLPADLTGQDPRQCGAQIIDRKRYVYITPRLDVAETYAAWAGGNVYSVLPTGPIIMDPWEIRILFLLAETPQARTAIKAADPAGIAGQIHDVVRGFACEGATILDNIGGATLSDMTESRAGGVSFPAPYCIKPLTRL